MMTSSKKMSTSLIKAFAVRLRQLRKERRLSQEKLALKAGINPAYVGMLERAEKAVSIRIVEKLARAMNIPPIEFFRFPNADSANFPVTVKLQEQLNYIIAHDDKKSLTLLTNLLEGLVDFHAKGGKK